MPKIKATQCKVPVNLFSEYHVMTADEIRVESFASEPLMIAGTSISKNQSETNTTKSYLSYKEFCGKW